MRGLLNEVTADDALPWPYSEDQKPIGIYVPSSPLISFSPEPPSPQTEPKELWRDVNGGEGPLSQESRPRRQIEPKLYTLFPENCPVTCDCRGNLMPGHGLTNMIEGDTLVNKLPLAPPPVQTILYYDAPDIQTYSADKATARSAKRERRGSKSKSKRNRGSANVKEESVEPEMRYIQLQRPARGYIPVKSLLGPFDVDAMEQAPTKARLLITISPSTAAATLPTPPLTADGTFSESHAASTNGSTASPRLGGRFEQQLTSPESEPMPIDPAPNAHEEKPPPDIIVEVPPQTTVERADAQPGLLPPIDMADLPELPVSTIGAQDPLPFEIQSARHWNAPLETLGTVYASTSVAGVSDKNFWPPDQPGDERRSMQTVAFGAVVSLGVQRPVIHPQFPTNMPSIPEHGVFQLVGSPPAQSIHQQSFSPSEALNFPTPSTQPRNTPSPPFDASSFAPLHSLHPSSSSYHTLSHPLEQPNTTVRPLQIEVLRRLTVPTTSGGCAQAPQQVESSNSNRAPAEQSIKAPSESPSNDDTVSGTALRQTNSSKPGPSSSTKSKIKGVTSSADADTEDKKGKKRFACEVRGCPATFTRKNDVERHMKSAAAHRNYAQEWADMQKSERNQAPTLNPFRCEKCSRLLSRTDAAKRHMANGSCGKRELPSEQAIAGKRDSARR